MAKRSNKKEPKIAVLTPYKAQKELVEDLVSEKKLEVTVNTINESQGHSSKQFVLVIIFVLQGVNLILSSFQPYGQCLVIL